jgi:hypothetical protein
MKNVYIALQGCFIGVMIAAPFLLSAFDIVKG